VELILPATPVALAPGVTTRVPVELRNPEGEPREVRVSVARGRVAGWASVEPATVTVGGGAGVTVEVVLRTPADQPPSGSLVPFTVHAEDTAGGAPAGFASGLVTVAVPVPVTGEMAARPGAGNAFLLRLGNAGDHPADLRISAELDPSAGSAEAQPAQARVEPGATLEAVVRARPGRPLIGTPKPYAVVVTVHDLQGQRLLTAVGNGTRRPLLPAWAAGAIAILLAVGATAAILLSGARVPTSEPAPSPAVTASP
jgi:hypothetical protein